MKHERLMIERINQFLDEAVQTDIICLRKISSGVFLFSEQRFNSFAV